MSRAPNIKCKILGNTYEMLCEPRIMYGVELCGLEEDWNQIVADQYRFCKKLLGSSKCTAKVITERELERDRQQEGERGCRRQKNIGNELHIQTFKTL